MSERVVLLPSNSTVLPIEITEDDVPNLYVSVVLVQGRTAAISSGGLPTASMKVGYVGLSIDPEPKLLSVALEGPEGSLLPGQTASYTVTAFDATGEPAAGQFSFDVVDKAILTLQPREMDRISNTFYGPRGLGVTTSSSLVVSLSRLVLEQIEDLSADDEGKYATDNFGPVGWSTDGRGGHDRGPRLRLGLPPQNSCRKA